MNSPMQKAVSVQLQSPSACYSVVAMVLLAQVNQMPLLRLSVAIESGQPVPTVNDDAYVLSYQGKTQDPILPGVSQWFVQSCASIRQSTHRQECILCLGLLPGHFLPMNGYACDGNSFSAVLNEVGQRFRASRVIDHQVAPDPVLATVLSFGETFTQFLQRMSQASCRWFYPMEMSDDHRLLMHWQTHLKGSAPKPTSTATNWGSVLASEVEYAAPEVTRAYWYRSRRTPVQRSQPVSGAWVNERMLALPIEVDADVEDRGPFGNCLFSHYLSNDIAYASAWPGQQVEQGRVALAVMHVYDQKGEGAIRTHLSKLVPGIRAGEGWSSLPEESVYGMWTLACASGSGWLQIQPVLSAQNFTSIADALCQHLGLLSQELTSTPAAANTADLVYATVCSWKEGATGVAGSFPGLNGHNTEIKVRFDWSDQPVRVSYAYAMSGSDGCLFLPPQVGDRVLVSLHQLWPMAAFNAFQAPDKLLPNILREGSDAQTLSGEHGFATKRNMVLRTSKDGDVVIHSGRNLILRADEKLIIDGEFVQTHERQHFDLKKAASL